MTTYARIENGAVAELLDTDADPALLFHPSLVWAEVSSPPVAVGWRRAPDGFAPPEPEPPSPPSAPAPTLAELQAQLAALAAQVAALRG